MKINRIIALICVFALCISLLPIVGTRAQAYSAHTADEAISWLNSLLNQKVGTGQCVALIKAYYSYLGVSAVNGHAYTYATDTAKVPSGWSRIEGATPQKGDVMIWTGGPEGYGHVAICGGDGIYFHQNFSGQYVEIRTSSYIPYLNYKDGSKAAYWGIIRPDFLTSSQAVSVPEPSDRAIASGNYMIKNAGSTAYFMNIYAGKDANGTKIVTWTIDTATDDQHFWFSHQGNGAYFIYAVGLTNRVLDLYYGSDSTISIGDYLQVWTKGADDNSSLFNVVPVGNNKYVFELKYMNNAVLTMTSASNNGAITLQQYTGSDAQHWYICDYSGNVISTCDLLGHSYIGTTETPTCTEQGCTTYVCTTCGDSYTADYVAAAGHSYESVITEPTAGAQGYTTHTCTVCGDQYIDSYIDPIIPEGLKYEINNGEVTIRDYTGTDTELRIPSTIEGYPVTKIGADAFLGCTGLTGVMIPDSVTSISATAFSGCTGLIELNVSENNIVYHSAGNCIVETDSKTLIAGCKTSQIPNDGSVTTIGGYAFSDCTGLTDVIIPDSVTLIGNYAFKNCKNLTSVTLGNSVKSIYDSAFSNCYKLTAITIPNSVAYIGDSVFSNCSLLTNVTIGNGVKSIGDAAFDSCFNLTYIAIPDSVTDIGENLFRYCRNLTRATIGNGVTSIDFGVFDGCRKLASVVIGDSVTSIGRYAFNDCGKLTSVTIPDSVTSIGDHAFCKCNNLAEIIIEYNVTSIGDYAFLGCNNLQTVYYTDAEERWEQITIGSGNDPLLKAKTVYWHILLKQAANQWNISLLEDIGVNFYFNVSEYTAAKTEVEVAVGSEKSTYTLSELPLTDIGYLLTVHMGAPQMTETITVKSISIRDGSSTTITYTIRQYCDVILGDESYSQYHQLVKEMLNYGAMSQLYFGHNTDNLANDGITGAATVEVPRSTTELSVDGEVDGIEFYGASLVYRDKIAVRLYYTVSGNIEDYTFAANGDTYTPVLKDGKYYVEVADILPQDLEQQITLTATDSNGNTLTVSYGPMNYIVRMNQKGSESLKALVTALYNYHLAAKALRTETV